MATTGEDHRATQRRRLPKITLSDPVGGSSDETPRTMNSNGSARQRRRAQQQQRTRHKMPNDMERVSSPPPKDLPLPPRTNENDDYQVSKRRKARRRAKSSSQLRPEPSLLRDFEDEIIVERTKISNDTVLPDLLLSSSYAGGTESKSAPTPRVFFENRKTISSVNQEAATLRIANKTGASPFKSGFNENFTFQQQTTEVLKRRTVQVAKQTHAAFQKFFLFIHGLNSGYALWICIFAFEFTNANAFNFFNTYRSIALITHLLFYLFLALSMVDVLDRVDPVKFDRAVLLQSLTLQNSAFAFLFYAIAMIVNLVMMKTEDYLRMTQYAKNITGQPYLTVQDVVDNQSTTWRNLTAVRAAFIIAGWIIVSIHVRNDRLSKMIKNTEEKAFFEELNVEQNGRSIMTGLNSP